MRSCLPLALFAALVAGQDVLTALEGNTALSSFRSLLQGNSDLVDQINAANHTLLAPNNDVRHRLETSYVKPLMCVAGPHCCWRCGFNSTAISCVEVRAIYIPECMSDFLNAEARFPLRQFLKAIR